MTDDTKTENTNTEKALEDLVQAWPHGTREDTIKLFGMLCAVWGMRADQLPAVVKALEVPNLIDSRGAILWMHDTALELRTPAGEAIIREALAKLDRLRALMSAPANGPGH